MTNDNNLHVYFLWIFKQEQQKNETCTESNTHPATGGDVHLCFFDKFHESNTTSKIEALRRIGSIPELNGKLNSDIEDQLLNMMQPATHIYLF